MGGPSTARQLAADDTRRRLFAAAVQMFSQHGYHQTTIDAIARKAGVAKGTFFVHFATKDAVVVELVRRQTTAARQARQAALAKGPLAALRATVLALGEQAGGSRELSRAVLAATLENAAVSSEANALFDTVLVEMVDDARRVAWRPGIDAEQVARGLMAVYLGAAYHFASSRSSDGMAALLEPLVHALIENSQEIAHAPRTARSRRS